MGSPLLVGTANLEREGDLPGGERPVPIQISLTAIIFPKNHDNLSSSIEKRRTRGSFCLAGREQCHSSASTTVLSKYLTFALGEGELVSIRRHHGARFLQIT